MLLLCGIMAKEKETQTRVKRKKHPQYDTARQLFVEANMDLKAIAETLGLSEPTVGKWCKENDWERDRELFQTMPQRLSERLQQMALRILELSGKNLEKLKPTEAEAIALEISFMSKISDAISKISKSIVNINNRLDESAVIQSLIAFDTHLIQESALHLAQQLKPHQQSFIKKISNGV